MHLNIEIKLRKWPIDRLSYIVEKEAPIKGGKKKKYKQENQLKFSRGVTRRDRCCDLLSLNE
uniref:Uncharacterized protein n=1 Tax=Glossina pallidipes TaxID=7398 RepID=A0A1B0A7L2_GLOPL